jgi:hypothetical protein
MRRQVQRSRNASGESVAAVQRLREKAKKELRKKKLGKRKGVVISLLRGGLYSSSRRGGRSAEPLGRKGRVRDNHHLTGGERGGVELVRGRQQLAQGAKSSGAERMSRQEPIAGGLTKAA